MTKFAVAVAADDGVINLEIVEAENNFRAAEKVCDNLGLFDDCEPEDNPRPEDYSELEDFLQMIDHSIEVKEVPA